MFIADTEHLFRLTIMVEREQLGDDIATMAAKVNVVNHQFLTHIRRFDQIHGWFAQGAMS